MEEARNSGDVDLANAIQAGIELEKSVEEVKPVLVSMGEALCDSSADEWHVKHRDGYKLTELNYYIEDGVVSWPSSGAIFTNVNDRLGCQFKNSFGDESLGLYYEEHPDDVYVRSDRDKKYYVIYRIDCAYADAMDINCRDLAGPIDGLDDWNY